MPSGAAAYASFPAARQQPLATAYKIAPLDRLDVTVFREPELSIKDVPVDEGGKVTMPLIGEVVAGGKSSDAVSADIATRLRRYLRNPQVTVTARSNDAARAVTVAGSVMQPGVYPFQGRMTLLQAVANAKGPSTVAALDQALIFRTINGQRSAARFDLNAIARGFADDPEVLPGDTVALGSSKSKTAWRDVIESMRAFNLFRVVP
jgi:polysaccharide biosynthesis/export protein